VAPNYTHFSRSDDERAKNGPKCSRGADDFKPIPAERGPIPHAACNYTKWPEVKLHDRSLDHAESSRKKPVKPHQ
jgi:hypothetical protein